MTDWPFKHDADRDDPLTKLRIAVTSSHPQWYYLVAFDRESAERPTDAEAAMLASFLEQYKAYWYGDNWFERKMAERPLDVDGGANGVVFRKYASDDWSYRRQSWTRGPMFVPQSPVMRERYPEEKPFGPLSLAQLLDHIHTSCNEVSPHWTEWKARHPLVFGQGATEEEANR